jgi:hypothetical protein
MADPQRQPTAPAGGVLLSTAVFGALAGAGGLAWWLWRQSRRRAALALGESPLLQPSRFSGGATKTSLAEGPTQRDRLPDRVQQLNQAIEDVRRQLESLQHP